MLASCTTQNFNRTKLNDTHFMKSILVAPWGEKQAEIIPTHISSGLAFEVTPTTKLAPILFELGEDNKTYVVDASFKYLTVFDPNGVFLERIELPTSISSKTVKDFKVLHSNTCVFLTSDEQSNYQLAYWNFQEQKQNSIALGTYRDVHILPSSNSKHVYCWTEKEDYSGILWQFSSTDWQATPTQFDHLPFGASRLFEKEDTITGIKFFEKHNLRGLISAHLKTNAVHEKVCAKELYGPLLYPIGMDNKRNLYTYSLPKEDHIYGSIYCISPEGAIVKQQTLDKLTAQFPKDSNTILTPYQSWKVLDNGTVALAAMTPQELHIFTLNI